MDSSDCIIEIRDDDIGIQQDLQEHIFEPLVTGDNSRGSKHGTGLGLAITKCIINFSLGKAKYLNEK